MKKRDAMKYLVLTNFESEFAEELVPATLINDKETGISVLNVMFEQLVRSGKPSYGEFFFIPDKDDESNLIIFESVITVADELSAETIDELLAAVASINYFVTSGGYAVDVKGGRLLYRHSVEVNADLNENELLDVCERNMNISLQMAAYYSDILIEVADGERDSASVIEYYAR